MVSNKEVMIQVVSGGENKHCDRFPVLSLHKGKFKEGKFWIHDKLMLHEGIEYKEYKGEEDMKICSYCENIFPKSTPFVKPDFCIRCYERENHVDREYYRAIVRKELIAEMRAESLSKSQMSNENLIRVLDIVKKDFEKEIRKMEYTEDGQTSLNNFYHVLNQLTTRFRDVIDPVGFLIWAEENDWCLIQAPGGRHEGNFQQRGKYYATTDQLLEMYKASRP